MPSPDSRKRRSASFHVEILALIGEFGPTQLRDAHCDAGGNEKKMPDGASETNWRKAQKGTALGANSFMALADFVAEFFAWKIQYGAMCDKQSSLLPGHQVMWAGLAGSPVAKIKKPKLQLKFEERLRSGDDLDSPAPGSCSEKSPPSVADSWSTSGRPQFHKLPPIANQDFTGRGTQLKTLRERFSQGEAATVQAIHGPPGIGKTRLAHAYLKNFQNDYPTIIWLNAAGRSVGAEQTSSLAADYAALLTPLWGRERAEGESEEQVIEEVRRWFDSHDAWLLVFDNAESLAQLRPRFLPTRYLGHTLITSQHSLQWADVGKDLPLTVWEFEEAKQYVRDCLPEADEQEVESLVEAFGRYPLGLAQATAYIKNNRLTIPSYLEQFETERKELWGDESAPSDYEHTIAVAVRMAAERLKIESLLVLQLLAMLAPAEVPDALVRGRGAGLDSNAPRAEEIAKLWSNSVVQNNVLRELTEYSLVQYDAGRLSMHGLVRASILHVLGEEEQKDLHELVVAMLARLFPDDHDERGQREHSLALMPHILQLAEQIRRPSADVDRLLLKASRFAQGQVRFVEARQLSLRLVELCEAHNAADHTALAFSYSGLALVEKDLGNYSAAKRLLGQAIEIDEAHYAPDHHTLAVKYANLALVEIELGHDIEAQRLLRKAIKIDEAHYAPDDRRQATNYLNLAGVERSLANYAEAQRLLLEAIAINEAHFAPDHPSLAVDFMSLALVEKDLGNLIEAKRLAGKAIEIEESRFGWDHPTLAVSYSNLATVESDLGNYAEARHLLEKAIEIYEMHYGSDHPNLAVSYSNLATVESDLGNYAEARHLLEKAIEIGESRFSPDHPKLAVRYSSMALVQRQLGNYEEAKRLLERAIEIDEAHYKSDHPKLAVRYSNLATVEQDLGNYAKAKRLLNKAIDIDEAHYAPDHPALAARYSNLALVEQDLGNYAEAKRLLGEAIEIDLRALPRDHPYLALNFYYFAQVEQQLGETAEAMKLAKKALIIQEVKLPSNHSHRARTKKLLDELTGG